MWTADCLTIYICDVELYRYHGYVEDIQYTLKLNEVHMWFFHRRSSCLAMNYTCYYNETVQLTFFQI